MNDALLRTISCPVDAKQLCRRQTNSHSKASSCSWQKYVVEKILAIYRAMKLLLSQYGIAQTGESYSVHQLRLS